MEHGAGKGTKANTEQTRQVLFQLFIILGKEMRKERAQVNLYFLTFYMR